MAPIIKNNLATITDACKKHHVKALYLFGSAARDNDFNDTSDIDLLYEFDTSGIDFDSPASSKDEYDYVDNFFSLKEVFESLFNRKVDLLPNKEIKNRYLKESIEKDKQLIYFDERFKKISA
jgi:predicted nucleotidyltransferase